MSSPGQSQMRTRMFARALGPFFLIVPTTIAVRGSHMRTLLSEFEANPLWAWVLGALLLMGGIIIIIIAFRQYWRNAAAIIVSLLCWFLAVRGVLLLALPETYTSAANALVGPTAYVLVGSRNSGSAAVSVAGASSVPLPRAAAHVLTDPDTTPAS